MSDFSHKGIDIGLTSNGQFVALVKGVEVVKKSLDAMTKFIDGDIKATNKSKFVPFEVLLRGGYRNERKIVRREANGLNKNRSRYGSPYFFEVAGNSVESVIPATPENEAALLASHEWEVATYKIEVEREKVQRELDSKISRIRASDMALELGIK